MAQGGDEMLMKVDPSGNNGTPNGSAGRHDNVSRGKSAVLTALCVGMGTRAKVTKRASKLKDFIKHGCSEATVEIDFANVGEDRYKPDVFGDTITVQRKIRENSNSFAIKDSMGRKIFDGKAEIEKFADHLDLDVDNPCSILSQDQSREFLHSGQPTDRYRFFVLASSLARIYDCLKMSDQKKFAVNDFLVKKQEELPVLDKKKKELGEKLEASRKIDELRLDLRKLRHKKAWAEVYNHDEQIESYQDTLTKLEKRAIPQIKDLLSKAEREAEDAKKTVDENSGSVDDTSDRISLISREQKMLGDTIKSNKRELNRMLQFVKDCEELIKEHKSNIDSLEKACEKIQMSANEDVSDKHKEHTNALRKGEDKLTQLLESLKECESAEEDIIKNLQEKETEKEDLLNDERRAESELSEARRQHKNLSSQGSSSTANFGRNMVQLMREIERAKKRFHKVPIGPVGQHTKLLDMRWATAVDESLSNLLSTFICVDSHDVKLLQECGRLASCRVQAIIVKNIDAQEYHMPQEKLPPSEHLTIHSVISTSTPIVSNVIIDSCQIERQVLAEDTATGRRIAFSNVRNVKEVFLQDGTKLFTRGSTQNEIARQSNNPPRLGMDNARRLEHYAQVANRIEEEVNQMKKRKREAETEYSSIANSLEVCKKKKSNLNNEIRKSQDELARLRESAPDESRSVEDQLAEFRAEIAKFEEKIEEQSSESRAEKQKIDGINANITKYKHEIKVKEDAKKELQQDNALKLQKAEDANLILERKEKAITKLGNSLDKCIENRNQIEMNMNEATENREKDREIALQICPEEVIVGYGGISETSDRLDSRLRNLGKRIERYEAEQGFSMEEVVMKLEEVTKRENKLKGLLHELIGVDHKMKVMINRRFDSLKRQSDEIRANCSHIFNGFLLRRGAVGRIEIDFKNGTLDIVARMNQKGSKAKDTKAFSGGERSFVTMAFILALANEADPPLLALDEYDIFMDEFSRKLSTTTLLEFAHEQKESKQLILITPHEIGHIIKDITSKKPQLELDKHVKILRMKPPRD